MEQLISRQAAIDALKRKQDDGKGDISRFYNTIIQHDIEAIEQLPPAEPKRGKWIHNGSQWENRWICSECGYMYYLQKPNFCPNCGSRNEVTT